MPYYEYECLACGPFEVLASMTGPVLAKCEKCGSPVRKLLPLFQVMRVEHRRFADPRVDASLGEVGSPERLESEREISEGTLRIATKADDDKFRDRRADMWRKERQRIKNDEPVPVGRAKMREAKQ